MATMLTMIGLSREPKNDYNIRAPSAYWIRWTRANVATDQIAEISFRWQFLYQYGLSLSLSLAIALCDTWQQYNFLDWNEFKNYAALYLIEPQKWMYNFLSVCTVNVVTINILMKHTVIYFLTTTTTTTTTRKMGTFNKNAMLRQQHPH